MYTEGCFRILMSGTGLLINWLLMKKCLWRTLHNILGCAKLYSITHFFDDLLHFFNKNQIIFAETHCSYFSVDIRLILSTSKKRIAVGGWGIHIFGVKVLSFLELPEVFHFFHIYGIHILVSIFSSINGASRILNLNLILLVLNLFVIRYCTYTYI